MKPNQAKFQIMSPNNLDESRFCMKHENIVATNLPDGAGLLIDLNAKQYFQINTTAMIVWRGIERRQTINEIAQAICIEYQVDFEQARLSVKNAIEDLQLKQLVVKAANK